MIITLCVITVIVRLFSLYRCKKHCDIVIEYSRILILTLRSDMMLTLHDDMRGNWGMCLLMKLCAIDQISVANISK